MYKHDHIIIDWFHSLAFEIFINKTQRHREK